MSRWISSTNPKKMDTNYEMLQKSQTHDMMKGCLWVCRKLGSPCSRVPAAVALLRCFSLHALVADLVVAQVESFYALVDKKRVGEGLQSWHEAKAKWTADSWAFHCSCAELLALSTGRSARQDCHSCPLILHVCIVICFLHFSTVYPKVTLQYLVNENTFRNHIPCPERG